MRDRIHIPLIAYVAATVVMLSMIRLLSPSLFGHDPTILRRCFAGMTVSFFTYLTFRSMLSWPIVLKTMFRSDGDTKKL